MTASPSQERSKSSRRRRRWQVASIAAVAACALALVAAEFYLRSNTTHVLGNPSASHGMYRALGGGHYVLTPGWEGEHRVAGRAVPVRVDRDGFRAPSSDGRHGPKRPGERRVLLLGDSLVFGYGVAFDETLGHQLEGHLEAATGTEWTVANAGTPGHGTWELALQLDHFAAFEPDVVVAGTSAANDFTDDCFRDNAVVSGYLLTGPMARRAQESWRVRLALRLRTAMLFERLLIQRGSRFAVDLVGPGAVPPAEGALALFPPREQWQACLFADRIERDALVDHILGTTAENYAALWAAAGDVPLVHVLIPAIQHVDPGEWERQVARMDLDPAVLERGRMLARIAQQIESTGRPVVNLFDILDFHAGGTRDQWLVGDDHLSPAGNAAAAQALVGPVLAATATRD